MKKVAINLYSFRELSEDAKEKAIASHKDFLDNLPLDLEDEEGEMSEYYHDHSENEVVEAIEANDYIFFSDGSLAHCVTYTGGPKKGLTEFHFKGEIIEL